MNSGHALRFTKGNKRTGREPKPILPTREDMVILRRAARGHIVVTMIEGSPRYTYEDGSPVSLRETNKDNGAGHFDKLVKEHWLVGDKNDSLFTEDPNPQIYRTRKP